MRLCIADPPYLGVAAMWYGDQPFHSEFKINPARKADYHPDAAAWDDPETHRAMLQRLQAEYDGWAIAMKPSSLWHYLQWVAPAAGIVIAAWLKPNQMPTNAHPIRSWEPVLVKVPAGRRSGGNPLATRDWLIQPKMNNNFAGAKPPQWTRWVLDMLAYDPETDTVDDLFHGSGAVAAEVAQGVML